MLDSLRRLISPSGGDADGSNNSTHVLQTETEQFDSSAYGSNQASVTYTCVDCNEQHSTKDAFSDTCGDGEHSTGGAETVPIEMYVVCVSHDCVWVKLITDDFGGRLAIPYHSQEYSEEQRSFVMNLEDKKHGDYFEATLIAENAEHTQWRLGEVTKRRLEF